ncbi:putative short-chain dehydrogenase/reductase [Mycolicibacterium sp. TY66]|uniref:mycofactocin-coupled SDR family oxidoreductase n=1 Tax=unclassified Mycolicibacterium TaxID=2636767 RepID=UPI001BB30EA7|nr:MULTISPECIES: mycofactocin-coupled SDR family oxidoreductase [unclassified Mycolicibacterium]BCI83612.1 putative short-chain dehydrogenase/reductase [Mycolicibacterium sp. TY66]BCJ78746.1 putative short-chain dehydrogenase/reductase [Mycolicibacterium sp. TY81]
MGLLDGKVAFVTGTARGMGRNHAIRLAREGASVIGIDVAADVTPHGGCPGPREADLHETVRLVEAAGGKCLMAVADVRDSAAMDAVVKEGVDRFGGRLDVVVANAGISTWARFWEMPEDQWQTMIDVNLTGVWRTMKAAVPHMIAAGNGGSIINISSVAGIKSLPGQAHYSAAKHGVVGLTKSAAIELAEFKIRVNSIHPWGVDTVLAADPTVGTLLTDHPSYLMSFGCILSDPFPASVDDISDAVIYLASDLSRAVTATQLTVDMGATKV